MWKKERKRGKRNNDIRYSSLTEFAAPLEIRYYKYPT